MGDEPVQRVFALVCEQGAGRAVAEEISRNLPGTGKVHVLMVTDRQFEQMTVFRGRSRAGKRPKPEQLTLF